ncbi:hypothetical protein LP414_33065 [Polaromonas sp. P1(28)-13]|nr:hypothetical protein LP414_33065 [Polaromonas sp. P1(28)-13]
MEAWHRGRALDQMLAAARVPVSRGVQRAPHHVFNAIDDLRQLEQARLLNSLPADPALNAIDREVLERLRKLL